MYLRSYSTPLKMSSEEEKIAKHPYSFRLKNKKNITIETANVIANNKWGITDSFQSIFRREKIIRH